MSVKFKSSGTVVLLVTMRISSLLHSSIASLTGNSSTGGPSIILLFLIANRVTFLVVGF